MENDIHARYGVPSHSRSKRCTYCRSCLARDRTPLRALQRIRRHLGRVHEVARPASAAAFLVQGDTALATAAPYIDWPGGQLILLPGGVGPNLRG